MIFQAVCRGSIFGGAISLNAFNRPGAERAEQDQDWVAIEGVVQLGRMSICGGSLSPNPQVRFISVRNVGCCGIVILMGVFSTNAFRGLSRRHVFRVAVHGS